ncbi:hypothetical protein ABOM_010232 [Aspergillus bombycis]|uniref:Major facilitator superfamily (MFS) profile domain-containing protein n=1 Tax=Aspergillus bombycis TaxID=109264 RepID=A0A1F7ZP38_9EURO|nr:hypothetical protein ABOM_010232 [Aspergillus bombycis]OGM41049.1 hypothetical protein ABOM_010232 [Aspergillus bombycis]
MLIIGNSQSELCKSKYRGRLVTTEVLFIGLGITIAYFFVFGLSFTDGPLSWRLPIAAQVVPALAICILVFGVPESPRWLMKMGKREEAISVLTYVINADPDDAYVAGEHHAMMSAVALEEENAFQWRHIFKPDPLRTGYRVGLASLALFMNQWAGINVIVFYAPTILENSIGLERTVALAVAGCVQFAFVVGSLVPSLGLDRLGRRQPMMIGSVGMAISMLLVSVLMSFNGTDKQEHTSKASIAFLILYMICFGASLNAIPWCYSTEILPLRVRAQGTALAVMTNWIWVSVIDDHIDILSHNTAYGEVYQVFTIVMATPTMVERLAWKTYLIFMAMNVVFVPLIYFLFPETSGLTLEDIDYLFMDSRSITAEGSVHSPDTPGLDEVEKGPSSEHVE